MTVLHLNLGTVSQEERDKLSVSQITVLCALRQIGSASGVADLFRKDKKNIQMVMVRIRKKGVAV